MTADEIQVMAMSRPLQTLHSRHGNARERKASKWETLKPTGGKDAGLNAEEECLAPRSRVCLLGFLPSPRAFCHGISRD